MTRLQRFAPLALAGIAGALFTDGTLWHYLAGCAFLYLAHTVQTRTTRPKPRKKST